MTPRTMTIIPPVATVSARSLREVKLWLLFLWCLPRRLAQPLHWVPRLREVAISSLVLALLWIVVFKRATERGGSRRKVEDAVRIFIYVRVDLQASLSGRCR